MSDDTAGRFSDEQAKAILARAIEIDSRAPMTTSDELRAIATEIGVSQASLEAALREQSPAVETRRMIASRRAATAVAAGGIPLGLAAGAALVSGIDMAILAAAGVTGVGFVASGALVVLQGSAGTLRSFHLRNLALWGGVAAGSLVSVVLLGDGGAPLAVLIAAGSVRRWFVSSILGSAAVVAVRRARRPESPDTDQGVTADSEPTGAGRWPRAAKRLLDWITRAQRWDAARALPAPHRTQA
jgi:hypothetical protein